MARDYNGTSARSSQTYAGLMKRQQCALQVVNDLRPLLVLQKVHHRRHEFAELERDEPCVFAGRNRAPEQLRLKP